MRADVSIDNAVRVATEMGWMYHNRMGERMERDKGKSRREKGKGGGREETPQVVIFFLGRGCGHPLLVRKVEHLHWGLHCRLLPVV